MTNLFFRLKKEAINAISILFVSVFTVLCFQHDVFAYIFEKLMSYVSFIRNLNGKQKRMRILDVLAMNHQ